MFRKLCGILAIFCIMCMCDYSDVMASQDYRHSEEIIQNYETIFDIEIDYDRYLYLYNGQEEISAISYEVNDNGYIVIDISNNEVVEYNAEENNYFSFESVDKVYYGGPLTFYKEYNDNQCITQTGVVIEKNSINIVRKEVTDVAIANYSSYPSSDSLDYSTVTYSENPDGRCGAVAAAILLKYYDQYYDSGYIPSSYTSSDGVTLINKLTNDYLGVNTFYATMATGLNSYLSDISMNKTVSSRSAAVFDVWSKTVEYIYNNKPTILLLQEHPSYENHYVVAIGYQEYYSDGLTRMYTINDGHGYTGANVNDNYVFAVTYIN